MKVLESENMMEAWSALESVMMTLGKNETRVLLRES